MPDDYVDGKEAEAEAWVNTKLQGYVTLPLQGPIPGTISTITELYAAGLILMRDYGSRVDTELTSKDGIAKIKLARELMKDYTDGILYENKTTNANGNSASASSTGDGNVFTRTAPRIDSCDTVNNDDFFMRREC